MEASMWFWLGASASCGALLGAAACWWPLRRRLRMLRERVERSEQARNGALERSVRAREQIAQINRAIDEMRKSHTVRGALDEPIDDAAQRARLEQSLAKRLSKARPSQPA